MDEGGNATVFIPAAPSFTNGQVAVAPAGSYKKLRIDSAVLNSYLVKLGKGLSLQLETQAETVFHGKGTGVK